MLFSRKKLEMPTAETALKGRAEPIPTAKAHFLNKRALKGPYPEGLETAIFGLRLLLGRRAQVLGDGRRHLGDGGRLCRRRRRPIPTYEEVCSGRTGHNEVVLVVFDPKKVSYETLLKTFWESHDPTQGMRQGNDVGTQYRSGIYVTSPAQRAAAEASKAAYQKVLSANGYGPITTEIVDAPAFYFAEDYHQQYLAKVPHGYCGLGGTGLSCPVGVGVKAEA